MTKGEELIERLRKVAAALVAAFDHAPDSPNVTTINAAADRLEALAQPVVGVCDPVQAFEDYWGASKYRSRNMIGYSEKKCLAWEAYSAAMAGGWLPIAEYEPSLGERVNLCWEAAGGLDAHVELGKWSPAKGWCNTYGHPFSGDPDYFQRLPEPPAPNPHTMDRVGMAQD